MQTNVLSIVYDGECPFCNSYVKLIRLRESVGKVELVDGRNRKDVVQELNAMGFDINQGMAVHYQGRLYYGGDAMNILANLSSGNGYWNHLISLSLRHKFLSTTLYPVFRSIRNLTLRLMNRKSIPGSVDQS